MKLYIVAIRDVKAEMFMPPAFERAIGAGIRNFQQGIAELPQKDDLILYHLGEYEDTTGAITSIEPVELCRGVEISGENVVEIA